ncbi:hypothetical protein TNCV_1324151 [Trichonephila clavipes]|nr:hypothetical protein TNCV_1324151 [Trichonephila clavipes]
MLRENSISKNDISEASKIQQRHRKVKYRKVTLAVRIAEDANISCSSRVLNCSSYQHSGCCVRVMISNACRLHMFSSLPSGTAMSKLTVQAKLWLIQKMPWYHFLVHNVPIRCNVLMDTYYAAVQFFFRNQVAMWLYALVQTACNL